jgi:hypothetical protein
MNTVTLSRCVLGVLAAGGILAGCGGSQTGMSSAVPQSQTTVQRSAHRASGSGDLLYVVTDVNVFYTIDYSTGKTREISYMGEGGGGCADADGNVYIAAEGSGGGYLFEFAHGGKSPINTLSDGSYYPTACSVDPVTGNLAVTNNTNPNCYGGGTVAVYSDAKAPPTSYSASSFWCVTAAAYDDQGNLFIGGMGPGSSHPFQLAELPKGGLALTTIPLSKSLTCRSVITCGNSVQWDGQYLAITQPNGKKSPVVYQVSVSGSGGTIVGTTTFKGGQWTSRTSGTTSFVNGNKIVMQYHGGSLGLWAYPAGGKMLRLIVKGLTHYQYTGLTLSPG